MAAKKKKTSVKASRKGAAGKKPAKKASKKAASKKPAAKKASKKAAPSSKAKGRSSGGKTRAQALDEARKKISRKTKTPRFSKVGTRAAEISQAVIQAYAAASREMAEWLAAARRSDKTA